MTWNERRKGWLPRDRPTPIAPPKPEGAPVPVIEQAMIVVPPFPAFSQVSIALLLKVARSTVQYWIESGKLTFYLDNAGERYVLREELIRFVREYLRRVVHD